MMWKKLPPAGEGEIQKFFDRLRMSEIKGSVERQNVGADL